MLNWRFFIAKKRPKNVDGMNEDIKEKNLPLSDIVSYLRGITAEGESTIFDIHKIFNLHYRGYIGVDIFYPHPNDLEPGFYYKNKITDSMIEQLYPYGDGYIIVIAIGSAILQVYIHAINLGVTLRSQWGGKWSAWRTL